ncbi:O-antigen translocase [Aeromonas taiwanensis]|uniref:O-antigen translocase n=1 Tax=Aeromonas taiwanensis TaxID=633417 RepID=A0A5F0KDP5_9GAMM|nr:O-antigen translocase [Aeromonas taiwanensis]TFF78404.1 O-antigen translocase [Aeromonas taiwanensis]TFF79024.1 O-antigen translocase [Aeromonas taiwanensis]TFF82464.1 O-antigen translocase [Aeromonas taiwanensis]
MNNNIIRAALILSAHLSKMLMGFFILKITAVYIGPEGLGGIGNFMSLLTIFSLLAGGGVLNGLIKYVSEYKNQKKKMIRFISSAVSYSLVTSVLTALLLIVFSKSISSFIFGSELNACYIVFLAIAQMGFAYTNIVFGVSNGLGFSNIYAKIQIVSCIIALPLCWWLIYTYKTDGAIVSFVVSLLTPVVPAIIYSFRSRYSKLISFSFSFSFNSDHKKLFSFTVMLITSAIAFPIVEIIIRQNLSIISDYHQVGIWQGATRISSAYTGVFAIVLSYWFMPLISAENNWDFIFHKTLSVMFIIMLLFFLGATFFYIWREEFISLLLSKDFLSLSEIIVFQLIGDFFKIGAYVVGFVGVAKAATRLYISAELIQSIFFVTFSFLISSYYPNAKGIMMGYAVTYFLYFFISISVFYLFYRMRVKFL